MDKAFAPKAYVVSILIVDDGSTEMPAADFGTGPYQCLRDVSILKLKRNLGHQRALAVGLCHIADKIAGDAVVVMDSDGQDFAQDAVRLVDKLSELNRPEAPSPLIVFAERTRRSESMVFRIGYLGYRMLHYVFTGSGIRFGNFSVIPRARLAGLTIEPMLWNHYAASVVASRLPVATISTERGARTAGQSHLSFVKLVIHGLSALSCYNEIIGVRLLILSTMFLVLSVMAIVITLGLRLITDMPLPGWTPVFAGILVIFLFQVITLASTFTLQIISARSVEPFLPARDYLWYIDRVDLCSSRT